MWCGYRVGIWELFGGFSGDLIWVYEGLVGCVVFVRVLLKMVYRESLLTNTVCVLLNEFVFIIIYKV